MVIPPQRVRCIRGVRTPEASLVWGRGRSALFPPNTTNPCQQSHWSRSLRGVSRASRSPCLGVCLAGAETTMDSLGWGTGRVKKIIHYTSLKIYIVSTTYSPNFVFLSVDQHTPTNVCCLNLKKTVHISCGMDHTVVLTKVGQNKIYHILLLHFMALFQYLLLF